MNLKSTSMNEQFLREITHCEPLTIIGFAKLMGIKLVTDEAQEVDGKKQLTPRPFSEILAELMGIYDKFNRADKRYYLRLLRETNKNNGSDK